MHEASTAPTDRTRVRRLADRGRYDQDTIHAVLDEALICHLGFAVDGRPWVIPTIYVRVGDNLYLHGAPANHALNTLASGVEACVTVTLIDGLVLARSAFHHSMNYRSVMVFGPAVKVDDEQEKYDAFIAMVEHLVPGRTDDTRLPSREELRKTLVLRLSLDECSAKVRTGGPIDDDEDMDNGFWAGVLPLSMTPSGPQPEPGFEDVPDYLKMWTRAR